MAEISLEQPHFEVLQRHIFVFLQEHMRRFSGLLHQGLLFSLEPPHALDHFRKVRLALLREARLDLRASNPRQITCLHPVYTYIDRDPELFPNEIMPFSS